MKREDLLKGIGSLPFIGPILPLIPKAENVLGGMWEGISRWRYVGGYNLTWKWFQGPPEEDDLWVARLQGAHIEYTRLKWNGETILHHVGRLQ